MKIFKGLFLCISLTFLAVSGAEANSNINIIKVDTTIEENIFKAIRSIDYTSINVLLSEGMDVNATNQQGDSPLIIAAKVGNLRILNIILSHNPDVDARNDEGKTALMIAAETGQSQVVEKLLAHNADPSLKDNNDNTALTLASTYGHNAVVDYINDVRTQTTFAK